MVIKDQQWIAGPITYRESVIGKGSGNAVVIDSNGDTGGGTALSITFTAQSLGAGMRGIFVAFDAVVNSIKDGASADNQWGQGSVVLDRGHCPRCGHDGCPIQRTVDGPWGTQ